MAKNKINKKKLDGTKESLKKSDTKWVPGKFSTTPEVEEKPSKAEQKKLKESQKKINKIKKNPKEIARIVAKTGQDTDKVIQNLNSASQIKDPKQLANIVKSIEKNPAEFRSWYNQQNTQENQMKNYNRTREVVAQKKQDQQISAPRSTPTSKQQESNKQWSM